MRFSRWTASSGSYLWGPALLSRPSGLVRSSLSFSPVVPGLPLPCPPPPRRRRAAARRSCRVQPAASPRVLGHEDLVGPEAIRESAARPRQALTGQDRSFAVIPPRPARGWAADQLLRR